MADWQSGSAPGTEALAKSRAWQADRQMDRQAPMHTDRETDTTADRPKDGGKIDGWTRDRQSKRLPDRHALLEAGQDFGSGRRHGDSKCL